MKDITPLKAIRAKCLECSGGKPSVVRHCQSVDCPLHSFRFGKNPKRTGIGVGTRDQNGRFKKNVTAEVGGSTTDSMIKENSADLGSLEASGKGIGSGQIDLESKGQFRIKRLNNQEIVITMKTEN